MTAWKHNNWVYPNVVASTAPIVRNIRVTFVRMLQSWRQVLDPDVMEWVR